MKFSTIEISDPRFEPQGLRYLTVKSPALQGRADVTVFIPQEAEGKRGIPTLVLLHGVYGSHWAWTMKGNVHHTLQQMIQAGTSQAFILAMPSDGLWGDGSGYVPHAIQNFEKWIGEELPSLLRQTIAEVDEASPFFISGLSMGGYGAWRAGLKYPRTYRGISAHSAITSIAQMEQLVEEDWSFFQEPQQGSIAQLVLNAESIPPVRFDCGLADELLLPNQQLHQFLRAHEIAHQYHEFPGGHEWDYWRKNIEQTFRFFSELVP